MSFLRVCDKEKLLSELRAAGVNAGVEVDAGGRTHIVLDDRADERTRALVYSCVYEHKPERKGPLA